MSTIPVNVRCKLCEKIESKRRRRQREVDRIGKLRHEASNVKEYQASLQEAQSLIKKLDQEIEEIQSERERRYGSCILGIGPAVPSIDGMRNMVEYDAAIDDDVMPTRVSHYSVSLYELII